MPPTFTEAHPPLPLDEITALIKAFPAMATAEKKSTIDRLVAIHPTMNLVWGPGWRYRRCRKLKAGELPETVDQLIWRKDAPATLGRANPAGFQVLYLGDRLDTALREARVENDPAVIAEFVIQDGHAVRIAPIGELAQIQRTGRGFLSGDASDAVSQMLNACSRDEARSLLITDAFLMDCMVGHNEYEITSHVALAIFRKNPAISAVAYPSVRQIGAINFAVRVEKFWEDWALLSVRYGQAKHLAMGYYVMRDAKGVDGIAPDGRLHWVDENSDVGIILGPPFVPGASA